MSVNPHELIQQRVNIGDTDPLEIARKVIAETDPEELAEGLVMFAEDVLAEWARQAIGHVRRRAEIALRPGNTAGDVDLRIAKVWIPERGYIRAADATPDDLRARAASYDVLAVACYRRAEWCREVAEMIEAEGCGTLGKLQAPLPALPEVSPLMVAA